MNGWPLYAVSPFITLLHIPLPINSACPKQGDFIIYKGPHPSPYRNTSFAILLWTPFSSPLMQFITLCRQVAKTRSPLSGPRSCHWHRAVYRFLEMIRALAILPPLWMAVSPWRPQRTVSLIHYPLPRRPRH